jgi:hypothetical protein
MNHQKTQCDVKCKQYTISIGRHKKKLKVEIYEGQGGMSELCQMVLGTVRW